VASERYGTAVELLGSPAAVIRQVVDVVMTLQPSVAGQLVSLATAPRAAFTLMRLAARDYKKASAIMDCMTDSSNSMAALNTRYKAYDMTRIHLQQKVVFANSSSMLTARIMDLMVYLKDTYGISATLIREMPDADVMTRKDTGASDTEDENELYESTKQVVGCWPCLFRVRDVLICWLRDVRGLGMTRVRMIREYAGPGDPARARAGCAGRARHRDEHGGRDVGADGDR